MILYSGLVEDRHDPLEMGRYRVRVFGLHTHDRQEIPTEALPWATVLQPATSAALNGTGITPKLLLGSHVLITYLDGEDMQTPLILGSVGGIGTQSHLFVNGNEVPNDNSGTGFTSFSDSEYIGASDIAHNARSGVTDILTPRVSAGPVEEPQDLRHNRQYPYAQVTQSESGHITEYDDTPGNERVRNQHRTGTYNEMRPDGSQVNTIVGDGYEIVAKDKNVIVKGNCTIVVENDCMFKVGGDLEFEAENITFDANTAINFNSNKGMNFVTNGAWSEHIVEDKNVSIGGNEDYEISGDSVTQVVGSKVEQVVGNKASFVSGTESKTTYGNTSYTFGENFATLVYGDTIQNYNADVAFSVFGNYTASVQGNIDMGSLGTLDMGSTGQMTISGNAGLDVSTSGGKMNLASSGTYHVTAGGNIAMDGPKIDLNSGLSAAATAPARTVSIIEEDLEALLETKPTEDIIEEPQRMDIEIADVEISVELPDEQAVGNNVSTQSGSVSGSGSSSRTVSNAFDAGFYDGEGRDVSKFDNVIYAMGGKRNKVVNSDLEEIFSIAARDTGIDEVVITSGKQPGKQGRRTGSNRHDTGWAADLYLKKDGKSLHLTNARDRNYLADFVRACVALGIRGGGMSSGYMGTRVMHLDTLGSIAPGGPPYDSSVISTWKSDQWFISAMNNPRTDLEPTPSFVSNSATPALVGKAANANTSRTSVSYSAPPKARKDVAQRMAKLLRARGFNDEECLAAIAVCINESGLQLRTETPYTNTSNATIRRVFTAAKKLSDAQLNQLKSNEYNFWEWTYNSNARAQVRKWLGNKDPGDGAKFIGRGIVQLTGRYNYEKYGVADDPEKLATDWDTAIRVSADKIADAYKRREGKDVLWNVALAIKGNGVKLTRQKDLSTLRSLDASWIEEPKNVVPTTQLASITELEDTTTPPPEPTAENTTRAIEERGPR